ncbi:ankyrin repeat domain-containing protein [Parashewanella curva]|uniref:Ankyrin repeat domain-containing protein n=1 Tax=Parashewanella curva TaxID=2338552 RepID=A0A3L8PX56_9GAMM|nr:ankyrin repeat domain-containing protein [Parashewanella curva]RLV59891.1 ankyrin repeat domain-containing protein [Parashewanella curva]
MATNAVEFSGQAQSLFKLYMAEVELVGEVLDDFDTTQVLEISFNRKTQQYLVRGTRHNFILEPRTEQHETMFNNPLNSSLKPTDRIKKLQLTNTNFSITKKESISDWVNGVNPKFNNNPLRYLAELEKSKTIEQFSQSELLFTNCMGNPLITMVLSCCSISLIRELNMPDEAYRPKSAPEYTALHAAAQRGMRENLNFLLENRANTEIKDHLGRTPIFLAVHGGHIGCVNSLILRGADIYVKCNLGDTPLLEAIQPGNLACVKVLCKTNKQILLQNKAGVSPLFLAWKYNCREIIDFFKEKLSIDSAIGLINTVINQAIGKKLPNKTPQQKMYRAVEARDSKALKELISDKHISFEERDKLDGCNAIDKAIRYSDETDCLELLIPKLKIVSKESQVNSLKVAVMRNNQTALKLLLKNIPDVINELDDQARSVAFFACLLGHSGSLKVLIDCGADLNINSKLHIGGTSSLLSVAASNGHMDCIVLLLSSGVDLFEENELGLCASDRARMEGHFEAFYYLQEQMLKQDRCRYLRRPWPEMIPSRK